MSTIRIECDVRPGTGSMKGQVRAWDGGTLLHEDRVDLLSASSRRRFCATVAERVGAPSGAADVESLLLAKLAELREERPVSDDGPTNHSFVRPDLFLHPDVIGLTLPAFHVEEGTPVGRWMLCLRWRDGRREVQPLPRFLDLNGDSRLWFHPDPTPPPINLVPPWSAESLSAWRQEGRATAPLDQGRTRLAFE